ncbi:calcium-binding protein [Phenylobacterium sp.]|uniref:calcium-binding protein n=1 Tax=Phenylobacterium sp. TaxID=1871053 RepID=UPI003784B752
MTRGTYDNLFQALGQRESGGDYGWVSHPGYLGRYQFGEEALSAVGFYSGHDGSGAIDFAGGWTAKAAGFGVHSKAEFLASTSAQEQAVRDWYGHIRQDLADLGLDKYEGQTIAGVELSASGLMTGAHLAGVWALKSWLETGGSDVFHDFMGTPITEYISLFHDYDTPFTFEHAGNDAINGGAGIDRLTGRVGDDTLTGAAGDDWVVGGKDQDRLDGGTGDDIVYGNLGQDTLEGGDGADIVRGGQGDDLVSGGEGADWLSGDRGDDVVTGGGGADIFHAFAGAGLDRVTDFHAWEGDRVMLAAGTRHSVSQAGADVVIEMDEARMVLSGVNLGDLGGGWIFEG